MPKILIIDDEKEMLESMRKILSRKANLDITLEQDPLKALHLIKDNSFDIIMTDLNMKGLTGMEILDQTLALLPEATVIMISGYGTVETSVEAMRKGAFDFIEKPFNSKQLFACLDRALNKQKELKKVPSSVSFDFAEELGIIYRSIDMEKILTIVQKLAPGNMNILVTGESGTGKEVIARAIHSLSERSSAPFVPVNCGALPEHLFESELFGHEKGAFTGAYKKKPGLLEFADKGTFFFDEVGDLSLSLQVKLLRMLEERKIRRVGSSHEIGIDVRIIAASNRDINKMVKEGTFREDLYYRLNTISIDIPPLRDRTEDIMPIANSYLHSLSEKNTADVEGFTREAEEALCNYPWPGNIRELQNVLSRAFFLTSSPLIDCNDLPILESEKDITVNREMLNLDYRNAKEMVIEKFEIEYLSYYLKKNNGNISKAALECGLDRRSIHRLINKYNIIYQE